MIHKFPVLIRETHLDTFGHVNNATYLTLYEEARWELITGNGYGMKTINELKQGPVILEVNLKYMKELRLRENIVITTELVGYKGRIGTLKQQMHRADGSIASEALFTFGLFDTAQRKLIEPTAAWLKAIGSV
ncbi:MAG: acyl-CoA thioesterase [Bdellovibrio sp. CG10_big_fil_rev_8_21_14_0_10_47_8]|nr:MAG: acyl-CoA thioesterase [Bdellovibrio sp. CG10_big_fil_rev_8_21_14_0_10_47_8]